MTHPVFGWVREQADRRERGHDLASVGALAWCIVAGFLAFVAHDRIPLLSLVDLGFHELGHLVSYPFGNEVLSAAMGSIAQVAVPLGIALYFGWVRSDPVATSVCLTWAATAARDVSVYIKDAPYQQLELIGGEHDWAFLLAGKLDRAEPLGNRVTAFGVLLLLTAGGLAVAAPFLERWRHDRRHHHNVTGGIRFLD